MAQQQLVDDLWIEFLSIGSKVFEKGYVLHNIPARLSTDWGRSCIEDRPEPSVRALALATASDDLDNDGTIELAAPVSPMPMQYTAGRSPTPAYIGGAPQRRVQQVRPSAIAVKSGLGIHPIVSSAWDHNRFAPKISFWLTPGGEFWWEECCCPRGRARSAVSAWLSGDRFALSPKPCICSLRPWREMRST